MDCTTSNINNNNIHNHNSIRTSPPTVAAAAAAISTATITPSTILQAAHQHHLHHQQQQLHHHHQHQYQQTIPTSPQTVQHSPLHIPQQLHQPQPLFLRSTSPAAANNATGNGITVGAIALTTTAAAAAAAAATTTSAVATTTISPPPPPLLPPSINGGTATVNNNLAHRRSTLSSSSSTSLSPHRPSPTLSPATVVLTGLSTTPTTTATSPTTTAAATTLTPPAAHQQPPNQAHHLQLHHHHHHHHNHHHQNNNTQTKIISRNANGTIVWTSSPTNEAELQLYRVMQRASLLAYYDTLLEMGGDDVQQLCEAGEEEFLEIMALVGMASKPLHVRRLQKALQEWLTNPSMFRNPLANNSTVSSATTTPPITGSAFSPRPVAPLSASGGTTTATPLVLSPQHHTAASIGVATATGIPPIIPASVAAGGGCLAVPPPPLLPPKDIPSPISVGTLTHPNQSTSPALVDSGCPSGSPSGSGGPSPGPPGSPLQVPPVLLEAQVAKLAEAAQHLVNTLPQMEPKSHTAKKKMNKDLEVLAMAEDDPRRMELIRKFAAIYGRFDCKRKPEKPLTLHEVSVNEAAAQICRFMPALLTRRDELFPLARQVVRDSGYHYSKGHSKSYARGTTYNGDQPHAKRSRYDQTLSPDSDEVVRRRQERLEQIADELRSVNEKTEILLDGKRDGVDMIKGQVEALQTRQQQLLYEQTQLVNQSLQHNRLYRRNSTGRLGYADGERPDTDDTDSQLSYSNDSSPLPNDGEYDHDIVADLKLKKHNDDCYEESFYQENKVQVIASSGGNIIAVANPALSMSPAMTIVDNGRATILKKDTLSAAANL